MTINQTLQTAKDLRDSYLALGSECIGKAADIRNLIDTLEGKQATAIATAMNTIADEIEFPTLDEQWEVDASKLEDSADEGSVLAYRVEEA